MIFDARPSRRSLLAGFGGGIAALAVSSPAASQETEPMRIVERIGVELVLNLVVTCSDMEPTGGPEVKGSSKDGVRDEVWPIVGGRFWGKGIRGVVMPGGADYPIVRPDGVVVIDALYRIKTDDGVSIVIHNKGLSYGIPPGGKEYFRTRPEFFAPAGKYDWLNKSEFIATLIFPVPPEFAVATGPTVNDRLIQVFRLN